MEEAALLKLRVRPFQAKKYHTENKVFWGRHAWQDRWVGKRGKMGSRQTGEWLPKSPAAAAKLTDAGEPQFSLQERGGDVPLTCIYNWCRSLCNSLVTQALTACGKHMRLIYAGYLQVLWNEIMWHKGLWVCVCGLLSREKLTVTFMPIVVNCFGLYTKKKYKIILFFFFDANNPLWKSAYWGDDRTQSSEI